MDPLAARAAASTASSPHPPANISKNHGPSTIFMPTLDGGAKETYSLTIRRPCRDRVGMPEYHASWRGGLVSRGAFWP
jgi:hypothetical protein